jgi:hypothetical protein
VPFACYERRILRPTVDGFFQPAVSTAIAIDGEHGASPVEAPCVLAKNEYKSLIQIPMKGAQKS